MAKRPKSQRPVPQPNGFEVRARLHGELQPHPQHGPVEKLRRIGVAVLNTPSYMRLFEKLERLVNAGGIAEETALDLSAHLVNRAYAQTQRRLTEQVISDALDRDPDTIVDVLGKDPFPDHGTLTSPDKKSGKIVVISFSSRGFLFSYRKPKK
jgi:hypothetical protein